MPLKKGLRIQKQHTVHSALSASYPRRKLSDRCAAASASCHGSHSPEMGMNPYPSRTANPNEHFLLQVSLVVES